MVSSTRRQKNSSSITTNSHRGSGSSNTGNTPRSFLVQTQWMGRIVAPEFLMLAFIMWFMIAVSLHILLEDRNERHMISYATEMASLRSVQSRVRPQGRERHHHHHGGEGGGDGEGGQRGDRTTNIKHYEPGIVPKNENKNKKQYTSKKGNDGERGNAKNGPTTRHAHPFNWLGREPRLPQPQYDDENDKKGNSHKEGTTHDDSLTPRQRFEREYPPSDTQRIKEFVQSIRNEDLDHRVTHQTARYLPYDPMDCPEVPPPEYPVHYSLIQVLEEWPVDDLQWPIYDDQDDAAAAAWPYLFHSLCVFDWSRPEHQTRAQAYQVQHDVPFLIRNHPEILQTSERWMRHDPHYLEELLGEEPQKTEHSTNHHLPFWRMPKHLLHSQAYKDWVPPTENVLLTFRDWYQKASDMDSAIQEGKDHTQRDHWYFRLSGAPDHNAYLYDELPLLDPDNFEAGENIFMWEPDRERGINCRMGMAGNVAEAHYDGGRNWIFMVGGGQRRYILAHPRECPHLDLYRQPHPSARHSASDWSDIGKGLGEGTPAARALAEAKVTQVILQASDALFLPTHWFHFIVSLNKNYQCNARSGETDTYLHYINECGFAK